MANTIVLKGRGIRKEREAGATISPGHLVEVISTDLVQVHSTAAGNAQKAFAVENEVIGNGIDDDYLVGDWVLYEVLEPGAEVQALMFTGESAVIGDFVESAGNGTLRVVDVAVATTQAQRASIVGIVLETVTGVGVPVAFVCEML